MTKIIKLEAKNIQRLKAVEVNPKGDLIGVGGNNGQGKSSLLNSITAALGGRKSELTMPIRMGEKEGEVICTLDDMIVTRKFTTKGDYLKVTSIDGKSSFSSPQAMLDKMHGELTFDPIAFANMEPKRQLETLKKLVGLDFSGLEKKRKELFDERTIVNREVKALESQINTIQVVDCPDKEVSVSELMVELDRRIEINKQYDELVDTFERSGEDYHDTVNQIESKRSEIKELESLAQKQSKEINALGKTVDEFKQENTQEIREQIQNAESINQKIREKQKRTQLENQWKTKEKLSSDLSTSIVNIDHEKANQLSNTKFPIDGLGFDDNGVTFKNDQDQIVPFHQASSAEKLRVSVAMGIAMNPKLKVLLIRDGSLLDESNLQLISDMASTSGHQIWLERVGKGKECQIIIEDGSVLND